MQPKIYVSCSPSKSGAIYGLLYCESGPDLYGWHIEARNVYFSAAFFMAENFYARRPLHLYRSQEDDVYGPWVIDYPPANEEIRCPVPDAASHELERMQSRFIEDWLFFNNEATNAGELSSYRTLALPVHEVNVKARRLRRMAHKDGQWLYMSPGTDPNVVQTLRKYWRLSEKIPLR